MKIIDILNSKEVTLSYEVFPPKKDMPFEPIVAAVDKLCQDKPDFMSVTYGAGGGIGHNTIKIADHVQNDLGVTSLAHLTCISSTKEQVETAINGIKAAGIENILALRGDIPADFQGTATCDFRYASDLVREIKKHGDFCIGAACYPEVHPESKTQAEDIFYLKEKVDAGVDFLTTQMFFDNNLLYNFLYKIREANITVPVVPGIMPITGANQVERAVKLSGSFMPRRFKSLVDKFGHDPLSMKQAGIAYATDQIIDLFANGITNVHVYSMNKPDVAEKILANLSDILGK
jgi:methylenetetrahydrofolate reductase (NADPH)